MVNSKRWFSEGASKTESASILLKVTSIFVMIL